MTVIEVIKKGFKITYRNWPLILIQFAVQLIMGFLFVIPVLIIIFSLGLYAGLFKGEFAPEAFLSGISEHPLLIIVCGLFLFFIWIGAILLNIFLRGGIKGIFREALIEQRSFTFRRFIQHGGYFFKRLFLLWLLFFLIFFLLLLLFGGIFGLPIYFLIQEGGGGMAILGVLLGISGFFLFLLAMLGINLLLSYSGIAIVIEDTRIRKGIERAFFFLRFHMGPILGLFFLFVLIGIGVIGFFFPFHALLKMGSSISGTVVFLWPFHLLLNLIQNGVQIYLTLFTIASTMILYLGLSKK